jgi:hypothetical protein
MELILTSEEVEAIVLGFVEKTFPWFEGREIRAVGCERLPGVVVEEGESNG